jgi:tRNA(fMet)-specific endonuclease VapC
MKYLFDTTAYSALLRGRKDIANLLNSAEEILIPNIVIAELQYGFRLGTKGAENEKLLSRFLANKKVRALLPDNATTGYFVDIAVFALKKGVQLSTHDIWIAAVTEQWNATLVTSDRDFVHLNYDALNLYFFEQA